MSKPRRGWARLASLGAMTTRVAGSYLEQRVRSAITGEPRDRIRDRFQLKTAQDVAETLGQLKGAAMKVGQGLSVLAGQLDLPDEVREALATLQSDAEPVPWAVVERTIRSELDEPLEDVFVEVETTPLGTASLAQAHVARLRDGREVVIKVLHEGVDAAVETDLLALRGMLMAGVAAGRSRTELQRTFEELSTRLREELDYLGEAANLVDYAKVFSDDPRVAIPVPEPGLCSERMLVMGRLPGVPLQPFVREASAELRQLAGENLAGVFLEQVFVHRMLHADPHPGNYLFASDGRVGMVDFGCVKRFDEHWIAAYARAVNGALDKDRDAVLQAVRDIGSWQGDSAGAAEVIWQFCETVVAPWRRGVYRIGRDSDDLVRRVQPIVTELLKFPEVEAPRDILLLHRTLGGLYSMARELDVCCDWEPIIRKHTDYAIAVASGRQVTWTR